jgi:hypothetical protein
VSDEVGLVATGLTEEIRQATEEIVVGVCAAYTRLFEPVRDGSRRGS